METRTESRLNVDLRRGESIGLFVCIAALMLVEAGYIEWLERLPGFPTHGDPVGFLDLPPWYDHPRAEVTLLLTILGGLIAWSSCQAWQFLRDDNSARITPERRTAVVRCLKTAGAFAVIAGSDMLLVQFLRT